MRPTHRATSTARPSHTTRTDRPARSIRLGLAALALAGVTMTACGSDDAATSATVAELTREDNPAIDGLCTTAEGLVTQISTLLATPGVALSTLQPAVDALNASATALVESEPGAVVAVSACLTSVSAALAAAAGGTITTIAGTATTVAGDVATTVAGGTDSANPEVQAFCTSADQLAAALVAVASDPASGDIAALTAKAQEVAAQAAALAGTSPADVPAIMACAQRVTDALTGITPGGVAVPATTVAGGDPGVATGTIATVDEFCAAAEDLGKQLADAIANPAGADVAAISAKATELSTQASALITANPADATRITDCLGKLNPTG